MGEHEIIKLAIERLAVGELKSSEAAALEDHLHVCAACSAYAARISKEREAFLAAHPYEQVRPETLAFSYIKSGELWYERLFGGFALPFLRPVLIPACLLLLVTMVTVPFMGRYMKDTTLPGKGFTYKGAGTASAFPQLPYIYKRNGSIYECAPGERLQAGDKVQVFYASSEDQYLSLVSIDSTGSVSFYQPDARSKVCSIKSGMGTRLAYPLSIDLDETPGAELVVALLSPDAFTTEQVKQWAEGVFVKGKAMLELEQAVHARPMAKSAVTTLLLKKQ